MPRRSGKHRREQGARSLSRYEFLAATHGPAVAARLRESKDSRWRDGSDAELFRRFAEKVDPSGADKDKPWRYLKWACTRYLETPVLPEDLYKIGEDLILFEDKKKRGLLKDGKADIQRYTIMTLADFTTELRGGALDGFDGMLAKAPASVMDATTIIYRGPEGVALVPHSREAAIHWSRGTRWCTGAENSNSRFFHYNVKGPLVILFTAVAKERYQGHVNSPIMDAQDKLAALSPALEALTSRVEGRFMKRETAENFMPPAWIGSPDWSNRDYALAQLLVMGEDALKRIVPALWKDRDFVLKAVQKSGWALGHAALELREDSDVVFEAVRHYGWALKYAASELQADRRIVLEAIGRQYGMALEYAAPGLRADREIVLKAVRQGGWALQYAAPELRADREIVLESVKRFGSSLIYASAGLRADREVVLDAVRQYGESLNYVAPELQADREIVLAAVRQCGSALQYAVPELKADWEFILEAVRQNKEALQYAAWTLRFNPVFLYKARQNVLHFSNILYRKWKTTDPAIKRNVFADEVRADWTGIAYAADCGVTPDLAMQREVFIRARAEGPEKLAAALHIFPALREEWKKRALTLDEAARLLGAGPVTAPVPVPAGSGTGLRRDRNPRPGI